jgi:hypothetical protein
MLIFNKVYFSLAAFLLMTELLIGLYLNDALIRPYGGDFLVVIMLYCLVKSFFNTEAFPTACYVLIFAYLTELSQYFHLVNHLGLQNSRVALMLMGDYFSFTDIIAYTLGILLVLVAEKIRWCLKGF